MKGQAPRPLSQTGPELYDIFLTTSSLQEALRDRQMHATAATLLRVNKASYDAFTRVIGYEKIVVSERNAERLLYGIVNKRKRDLLSLCTHLQLMDVSLLRYWLDLVDRKKQGSESYNTNDEDDNDEMSSDEEWTKANVLALSPFGNVTHLALSDNLPWTMAFEQHRSGKYYRHSIVKLFFPEHLCINYTHDDLYHLSYPPPHEALCKVSDLVGLLVWRWSIKSLICHGIALERLPAQPPLPFNSVKISFGPIDEESLRYVYRSRFPKCGANQRTLELSLLCEVFEVDDKVGDESGWTEVEIIDAHHCLDPPKRRLLPLLGARIQTMDGFVARLRDRLRPGQPRARFPENIDIRHGRLENDEAQSKRIPFEKRVKFTNRSEAAPCNCCGRI